MTPAEELTRALLGLAARGQRPRCGDAETAYLWTSSELADRREAARLCVGCRVLVECRAAGEYEPAHVWGGVDRTPGAGKAAA